MHSTTSFNRKASGAGHKISLAEVQAETQHWAAWYKMALPFTEACGRW